LAIIEEIYVPKHPAPVQLRPAVTEADIQAASLQFVRKISGFTKPSKANEAAFQQRWTRSPPPPASCSTRSRRMLRHATGLKRSLYGACAPPRGSPVNDEDRSSFIGDVPGLPL